MSRIPSSLIVSVALLALSAGGNPGTTGEGALPEVVFSHYSGLYRTTIDLTMTVSTSSAEIYYTVDGSTPTVTDGNLYLSAIAISANTVIRARAFRTGFSPSSIGTRTYLFSDSEALRSLPIVSVVTSPDNLVGRWGIFDNNLDYGPLNPDGQTNVFQRGRAWERPANIEWISKDGSSIVNAECGIRLHASPYERSNVDPHTKNSLRVYFREEYGAREISSSVIPLAKVSRFKRLVLRAGKNDDTNPFIKDEMVRRIFADTGNVSSVGTFAFLFLNGELKGYYNPVERLDDDFMRDHFGGDSEWDVIRQGSEAADGDNLAWLELLDYVSTHDLSDDANYLLVESKLDIANFVDYLLVNIYARMLDWPTNNWTAARERISSSRFRFYVWDAEGAFDGSPVQDWFQNRLLPPNSSEIPTLFQALLANEKFRSLWGRRFRKHFYGAGGLTNGNLRSRWLEMRAEMSEAIPNLRSFFPKPWVDARTPAMIGQMFELDLLEPINDLEPRATSPLSINEFMAANVSTIADEAGEFDDWIEIYNQQDSWVDLSGMFLTDNLLVPTKWAFPPGTAISPLGYLLVWADSDTTQGNLHTNFRLSRDGDEIGLFDTPADGNSPLDTVTFGSQQPDVSEGRRPDGTGSFSVQQVASPGASNGSIPVISDPSDYWVRTDLHVGNGVRDIAIGDVDGDGTPDVVAADHDFGRVAVFLGSGPGTRTFQGPLLYPAGLGAKAVALADLNGDLYLDIVTVNDSLVDYSIAVLLNNGDGTFSVPVIYPLYSISGDRTYIHPRCVQVGDLNGDNWMDIVVSNESPRMGENFVSYFLNRGLGDGRLDDCEEIALPGFAWDVSGKNLILEDLDGDSDKDMVTLSTMGHLDVSFNQGDGVFEPPMATPAALSRSKSIVSVDYDGDGDSDIASSDGNLSLFLFSNNGDGTFDSPSATHLFPSLPTSQMAAADYNGDGISDLALAQNTRFHGDGPPVKILLNDGLGNFTSDVEGIEFPHTEEVLNYCQAIATADLDQDTASDLVVADGASPYLVVFFNEAEAPTPPTATPLPVSVNDWGRY